MMFYKYIKLERAKGGYLLSYDKCVISKEAYDGYSHMGQGQEVFEDGAKALKRMDELYKISEGVSDAATIIKKSGLKTTKLEEEEDDD